MAVLCDFSVILNGVAAVNVPNVFAKGFNSGGRRANSTAFMTFGVKGLNHADVSVLVNNQNAGKIEASTGVPSSHWSSQTIVFDSDILSSGDANDANTIEVQATHASGDFCLKDIVCFFHQAT